MSHSETLTYIENLLRSKNRFYKFLMNNHRCSIQKFHFDIQKAYQYPRPSYTGHKFPRKIFTE